MNSLYTRQPIYSNPVLLVPTELILYANIFGVENKIFYLK